MYLLIFWCCVRKGVSSWSSHFLLTVLFRWSNLNLVYFFGFSLYRHQYVCCYFHSRNKIFCFALKCVTDSFHYSASQRILVAAIISQQKTIYYHGSLERIAPFTAYEAPTCTLKPNNGFCIQAEEVC